jgi:hypothetical protein
LRLGGRAEAHERSVALADERDINAARIYLLCPTVHKCENVTRAKRVSHAKRG